MTYEKARPRFQAAIMADPDCLLAYWGAAMTYIHPLWPDRPTGDDLAAGTGLLKTAEARREATPVEEAFFLPLRGYYRDAAERSERERLADFAEGWAEAAEKAYSSSEKACMSAPAGSCEVADVRSGSSRRA